MPTIKEEMKAIDTRNLSWWDSLSEEEQKSLSTWVLMRFTSSTTNSREINEHYLQYTNELVNVNFNKLKDDPQLQVMLMQLVGIGSPVYHKWLAPGKKGKEDPVYKWLAKLYPRLNDDEIELLMTIKTRAELKEMAQEAGLTPKEIKKIFK